MLLDINIQFKIVIFAILSGIIIGFLFDIYREFRGVCKNKILITIEDILFWIWCSLIVFVFLLKYNYALIGVYVYVFMGITLVIYLKINDCNLILFHRNVFIKFEVALISYPQKKMPAI